MPAAGSRVRRDQQRATVVAAAVSCFAQKGYYGTTTTEVAARAGISQPYIYRLFPDKQALFAEAVDHVGQLLTKTLVAAADAVGEERPVRVETLDAAYRTLAVDQDVRRFLMQANCATDEPRILAAVRTCYARQVAVVADLLGGNDAAVRSWFATGMLENVVAALALAEVDEAWARVLRP